MKNLVRVSLVLCVFALSNCQKNEVQPAPNTNNQKLLEKTGGEVPTLYSPISKTGTVVTSTTLKIAKPRKVNLVDKD